MREHSAEDIQLIAISKQIRGFVFKLGNFSTKEIFALNLLKSQRELRQLHQKSQ